jgi:glycosyltransferase involved in cell wall biosynthesis
MHIVFVIAPGGGPEANVKVMVPWLERHGHRVSVVYSVNRPQARSIFPRSVQVAFATSGSFHYYMQKAIGDFHALPRRIRAWELASAVSRTLSRIDRGQKIDLVEVTEGMPVSALRTRWRVTVRAHGSDWTFRHYCQDGDTSHDRWLIELEARQLREAHSVSALSHHLAEHLSEACQFPSTQIDVIPYPIDTSAFCPGLQAGAPTRAPILLTVGRLERRKGADLLLGALAKRVWQCYPELTVCFPGSETDLTQRELLDLVPAERRQQVIFPGFVDRAQIVKYYQRATLYVTPTLYETFGYTVLEALACGVPVVASRVGAIPELVEDGATGLLVEPHDPDALADAILTLLDDPVRRDVMGQRAREKAVSQYAVKQIMDVLLPFYERAASSSSRLR